MKVAIIGGGITGLSALHALEKSKRLHALEIETHLYEASSSLGGKIKTEHQNGFIIERGPDSFLARKPEMVALAKEIGLEKELVANETGQAYIWDKGRFHPIPAGSMMGIPTMLRPYFSSSLVSLKGKIRTAADLVLPASRVESSDESLGLYFKRRFGAEHVERVMEPLLSGIYAGEIDELSLEATFPQFRKLGRSHRSLILGARSQNRQRSQSVGTGQKSGMFRTVHGGLDTFVKTLAAHLPPESLHTNRRVIALGKNDRTYTLTFTDGTIVDADHVIFTVPHKNTVQILPNAFSDKHPFPADNASIATVALAFPQEAVKNRVDGTGFLIPNGNNSAVKACTFVDKKWPHEVPSGYVLLRCFVGRPGDTGIVLADDNMIVEQALKDIRKMLRIDGHPLFTHVERWQENMPKYTVGHSERVESWEKALSEHFPNVYIAGASYGGVGLPDCVRQGQEAVEKIVARAR